MRSLAVSEEHYSPSEAMQKPRESLKHAHSGKVNFFLDEKKFCVDPVRNNRNNRYIRLEGSEVEDVPTVDMFITETKHPASLMFLSAVASTG